MRIHTLCFVMFMIVWTPFGFKVENVEVIILVSREHMMNQSDLNIFNRMGKRTIVTIFALLYFVWEAMTKLGFILVFMI